MPVGEPSTPTPKASDPVLIMTSVQTKPMVFTLSESGDACRAFDVAAQVLIRAMVNQGREYITLCELYSTLGAETKAEKTSVRLAVLRAKNAKVIGKTGRRSVYEVCQ